MKATFESLLPVLFAVSAHELGHIVAMFLSGISPRSIKGSLWGIRMTADFSKSSYIRELFCVLAGSGANFFLALLFNENIQYTYAFVAYGIFNLLPANFLDGGEALRLILSLSGIAADMIYRVCHTVTTIFTFFVWVAAVYFALKGNSVALLLSVFYMMGNSFFDKKY